MKTYFAILLTIVFIQIAHSQELPSVTLDPSTGNYLIIYKGVNGDTIEVIFVPATKIEPTVEANVLFNNYSQIYQYRYTA